MRKLISKYLLLLLIIVIGFIVINQLLLTSHNGPCVFDLNPELENSFIESFSIGTDLNNMVEFKFQEHDFPWTFLILNHSVESIAFPDNTYGLQGFWPNSERNIWMPVDLPIIPSSSSVIILPPSLTTYDPSIGHQLTLLEEPFSLLGYDRLRLLIIGEGLISNKSYASTKDLCFESK